MVKVSTHIPKQPRNGFYKKENISYAIEQPKIRQTNQIRKDETKMTSTALQVTNFDFYGDILIALQDNATGEIYTAINSVLRGIELTERQVRHNREKWLNDLVVSKGCQNFVIPMENGIKYETYCISDRKLPIRSIF